MSGTSLQPAGNLPVPPGRRQSRRDRDRDDALPVSVLEFRSPSAALIAMPAKPAARYTTWAVSSLAVICLVLMSVIRIDREVAAPGKLTSAVPTIVIQPLETSIVRGVYVREGDMVHKGQLLAQLDPTVTGSDVADAGQQVDALQSEVDRLRAEASGQQYVAVPGSPGSQVQAAIFAQRAAQRTAQLSNYAQQIEAQRALIQKDEDDAAFYRQRMAVAQNVESMRLQLQHDAVGSRLDSLAATDNRLEMTRSLAQALSSAQSERQQMGAIIAQRDAYDQQWRSDVSQQLHEEGLKLSDARNSLRKDSFLHKLVDLRASQDAIVLNIARVSVGSVLQTGDQLMQLVPADAPLEVEADIPGRNSGFVHVGDKAVIKFDTFPYVRYGSVDGTVRSISADSFLVTDPSVAQQAGVANSPIGANAPSGVAQANSLRFYQARISLDKIKLHGLPPGFHFVPGMPLEADIEIGRRTVMTYLLGRVMPVASEGMREP